MYKNKIMSYQINDSELINEVKKDNLSERHAEVLAKKTAEYLKNYKFEKPKDNWLEVTGAILFVSLPWIWVLFLIYLVIFNN